MAKKRAKVAESTQAAGDQSELSELSFEEALEQLDTIVQRMEHGGTSLEQALDDYSVAVKLLKTCRSRLDKAERQVQLLSGVDADGNPITEDFATCDSDLESKSAARSSRRSARSAKVQDDHGLF